MKPKQRKRAQKATAKNSGRLDEIKKAVEGIRQQYEAWRQAETKEVALRAWQEMPHVARELEGYRGELSRFGNQGGGFLMGEISTLADRIAADIEVVTSRQESLGSIRDQAVTLSDDVMALADAVPNSTTVSDILRDIAHTLQDLATPGMADLSPCEHPGFLSGMLPWDLGGRLDQAIDAAKLYIVAPSWDGGQALKGQRDTLLRRLRAWEKGESFAEPANTATAPQAGPVIPPAVEAGAPSQSRTHPRKRRKTPPQLLKETRERHAARLLAENPNITSRKLAKLLECDPSTVTRLTAWQNKGVLHRDPPRDRIEDDLPEEESDSPIEDSE